MFQTLASGYNFCAAAWRDNLSLRFSIIIILAAAVLIGHAQPSGARFPTVVPAANSEMQSGQDSDPKAIFQASELPKRLAKKPEVCQSINQALRSWREKQYDAAVNTCRSLNQSIKLNKDDLNQLSVLAQSKLNSGAVDQSVILYLVSFESMRTRANADDVIAMAYKLALLLGSPQSDQGQRALAAGMLEHAFQIRKLNGGIKDSDAPYVLEYARLEFALHQWQAAETQYKLWIAMFENKGKSPPAQDLPDALAELATALNHQKRLVDSEEYFKRAVQATRALNGSTITPINHYDVEEFYIYALVGQHKIALARELTIEHLKARERELGGSSPELAKILTNYADMFEEIGEVGFAFSLRNRAAKVAR